MPHAKWREVAAPFLYLISCRPPIKPYPIFSLMSNGHDKDDNSSSSESTNEVFFEMLGLPVMDAGAISLAVDVDDHQQNKMMCSVAAAGNISTISPPGTLICNSISSAFDQERDHPIVSYLDVPQKCSRYLHKPSTVAAFVVNNLITLYECQTLIQLAEELSATGFHYVTEASHVDDEGKVYSFIAAFFVI
jgi:hypothetical protein